MSHTEPGADNMVNEHSQPVGIIQDQKLEEEKEKKYCKRERDIIHAIIRERDETSMKIIKKYI